MSSSEMDEILGDLEAEGDVIEAMLDGLDADGWELPSGAPGWAIADVVLHLAMTEEGVVTTLARGTGGWTTRDRPLDDVIAEQVSAQRAPGAEIGDRWRRARRASITALRAADPSIAVGWAAAPLRPRTLATTRLAEHWAHALDIAEPLAAEVPDTSRLRHIAWLGHSTLPYAMRLAGMEPCPVRVELTGPAGEQWVFGPPDAADRITGAAAAFCRVGARRVSAADSGLRTDGPAAAAALSVLRNYAA